MKAVFSSIFKSDLLDEQTRYSAISPRLGDDFYDRVRETVRTIVTWRGGDHVGPHGYPCRRCRPFPYLVYYEVEEESIYFLGLVHIRRHPDYLKQKLADNGG